MLHRAHRIVADGGLGRQHHGVRAVHDRVRDVRDFGARRRRRVDHRLEHLRGRDHDLVTRAREPDQALLQARHRRVADLDREVAARHHDDVARVDDRANVLHGFGALDLRDDVRLAARGAQQRTCLFDVIRVARERDRHEVEPIARGRLDVAPILVRERRRGQAATLLVEALVIAELAALLHAARDLRALDTAATSSAIRPSSSSTTSPGATSLTRLRYATPTAC